MKECSSENLNGQRSHGLDLEIVADFSDHPRVETGGSEK